MSDLPEGTELGGCRIEKFLARGGMGEVYRALHLRLDRTVALKLLSHELSAREDLVESFMREARAAARLEHPRIVQVYDAGCDQGRHYIILQYIDGESLYERIRREQRLHPVESVRLVKPVLEALREAHGQGIIHRDVKPGNILIGKDGAIRLSDFGLAIRAVDRPAGRAGVGGTPEYMAPELGWGVPADARSDLYAVGATWFHMLAGRPPFEGANAEDTLAMHVNDPLPDIHKLNADVSSGVAKVLDKMMAKARESRYASAQEALAALESPSLLRDDLNSLPGEPVLDLGITAASKAAASGWAAAQQSVRVVRAAGGRSSERVPTIRRVVTPEGSFVEPRPARWSRRLACAALLASAGACAYALGRVHMGILLSLPLVPLLGAWVASRGGIRLSSLLLASAAGCSLALAGHRGLLLPAWTSTALQAHLLPAGLALGFCACAIGWGRRRTRLEARFFSLFLLAALYALYAFVRLAVPDGGTFRVFWPTLAAACALAALAACVEVWREGATTQGLRGSGALAAACVMGLSMGVGDLRPVQSGPAPVAESLSPRVPADGPQKGVGDEGATVDEPKAGASMQIVIEGDDTASVTFSSKPKPQAAAPQPPKEAPAEADDDWLRALKAPARGYRQLFMGSGSALSVGLLLLLLAVLQSFMSAAHSSLRD